ncbi:histidine kinase [Pseudomonas phoenicis]|uniref:histidine kinase n=1 Tax=unclassified Pseudomonas TaxID=196821 RepID=UPI00399F7839
MTTDTGSATAHSLQLFVHDAEQLLAMADDCLAHLRLIANDADACRCLLHALDTLVKRAAVTGVEEISAYAARVGHLLSAACRQRRLAAPVVRCAQACLTLLAWQLELLDPITRRVDLDEQEQHGLLDDLAKALQATDLAAHSAPRALGSPTVFDGK